MTDQLLRIVLVDDHPMMLDATRLAIQVAWPRSEVRCATDLDEVQQQLGDGWAPHLALLDLGLPGQSELSALATFRERFPDVPVVIFSGLESREHVLGAIDGGAMGFIPKKLAQREVLGAMQRVMAGEIYLPAIIMNAPDGQKPAGQSVVSWLTLDEVSRNVARLTPRQREVMLLMLQGLSNLSIGARLAIAEGTVKVHMGHVLAAFGAAKRVQAVIVAAEIGLRVQING